MVIDQAEQAFASSLAIAIGVSLLMAAITSVWWAACWWCAGSLPASPDLAADAADAIAAGNTGWRIPAGGFGMR